MSSATKRSSTLAELAAARHDALANMPEGQELYANSQANIMKLLCTCPICERSVGASRFAPHLEKCQQRRQRALSVTETTPPPPAWDVQCAHCKTVEQPELMLMCDGCSRVFHTWCLTPRLPEIPQGYWFCRRCHPRVEGAVPASDARPSATQKALAGRLGVNFEVVDFVCDLCQKPVADARWRCLTCGEFDTCEACRGKSGLGHRPQHKMVKMFV